SHPALSFDVPGLLEFALVYMGSSVAQGSLQNVAGAAILVLGVASIASLGAQGRVRDAVPWIVLFGFAPFNALVTGIGRLGFGMLFAESSRYHPVTALTLIATIALALLAVPKAALQRPSWFGTGATVVLFLLGACIAASYSASWDHWRYRNGQKLIAEIAMRQGLDGRHHLRAATPVIQQLESLVPTLRAAEHVPFTGNSQCEDFIGQKISRVREEPLSGYLDRATLYELIGGRGQGVEMSGWAVRKGRPAECIVIVDGNRIVIGAGATVEPRPDVERAKGRSLDFVGWRAVARVPQAWPVCAYAMFSGSKDWFPLAKCRSDLGDQ
ncbi:MAG: hypothetical protein R3D30_13000, partial [Hyphomicrobiales bacterium]